MELKELLDKTLTVFNVNTVDELSDALYTVTTTNDKVTYANFLDLVQDLSVDWLQKIFQYYQADRKEKMQDYTPKSLAKLVGKLTECKGEKKVFDLCAGSGALTIQKWNANQDLEFVCFEFDKNVIPYLLFNLALRNIKAIVINGDALSGEIFATYEIIPDDKFAIVNQIQQMDFICDTAISNPPYNMKWIEPPFAQLQSRFANCEIPPESNANYAFILTALDKAKRKSAFILPNGVLSTDNIREKAIRTYLVENNLIESVIMCPDGMFESTPIPVCVLLLDKQKSTENIMLIDMRSTYDVEQREQNGQYGDKSHTNRTYTKAVKVFNDKQIDKAIKNITEQINEPSFSKSVTLEEVKEKDYNLTPTRYIDFECETKHRDFAEIIADINEIEREKSVLKLTINESLARKLGFADYFEVNEEENAKKLQKSFELVGGKYDFRKYITFSKNKNEFKIENQDKEILSSIIEIFVPMWWQHITYLKKQQNKYFAEFRDALLPELMSGKIDVSNIDVEAE